ncbi:MAG: hypothetical protein ACOH2P_24185, partial [Pseudomonas sp.]
HLPNSFIFWPPKQQTADFRLPIVVNATEPDDIQKRSKVIKTMHYLAKDTQYLHHFKPASVLSHK